MPSGKDANNLKIALQRNFKNLARSVINSAMTPEFAEKVTARLIRANLMSEDFIPFGVHSFERDTWVLKETKTGIRIWCSLDERAISRPILLNSYELAETEFIARTVRSGSVVIDAGANLGYHTLHAAQLVGKDGVVHAFEPLPFLADALEASILENSFQLRIKVYRSALDERAGQLLLRHAPKTANFGGAHLAVGKTTPAAHTDIKVKTVSIDETIPAGQCNFIKIDIEGAEPRLIEGAKALLSRSKPIILSELHEAQLRAVSGIGATDYIKQLSGYGYSCFRLNSDGTQGRAVDRFSDLNPVNVIFRALEGTTS